MTEKVAIYVFRARHHPGVGETVYSAAPLDAVVAVYGGGGAMQADGLSEVFGGAAVFRDDSTGERHLGVWGKRNAAKFRNSLRQAGLETEIVNTPPPGRLVLRRTVATAAER